MANSIEHINQSDEERDVVCQIVIELLITLLLTLFIDAPRFPHLNIYEVLTNIRLYNTWLLSPMYCTDTFWHQLLVKKFIYSNVFTLKNKILRNLL